MTLCHKVEIFLGSVAGILGFFAILLERSEGLLRMSFGDSKKGGIDDDDDLVGLGAIWVFGLTLPKILRLGALDCDAPLVGSVVFLTG